MQSTKHVKRLLTVMEYCAPLSVLSSSARSSSLSMTPFLRPAQGAHNMHHAPLDMHACRGNERPHAPAPVQVCAPEALLQLLVVEPRLLGPDLCGGSPAWHLCLRIEGWL